MMRLRDEMLSMATVLAIPLAIAAVFPYDAIGFRAQDVVVRPSATVAFVRLSEQEESQAVRASRSVLRGDDADVRRLHADLLFSDLPDAVRAEILPASSRRRQTSAPFVECPVGPYLPSLQAPPPARIKTEPSGAQLAFPKSELLKID